MTTLKTIFVISMAMSAGACATVAPVPVTLDTSFPAVVDTDGLRATLRVLPRAEADRVFGGDAGAYFGVVELNVQNRGTLPVSVKRKVIRIVTPTGEDFYPVSPLGIANLTRGHAMISTGSNALDLIQLIFGAARLAQNYDVAAKWDHLMPETFKVAAGEERCMLLGFSTPQWAPGLWRLELPFSADSGAAGPRLSIPLTFQATARPPG